MVRKECIRISESHAPIRVNLQFFASEGEKTEKATPKRRRDAREKGQVLQSREVSSALVLLLIFLTLKILTQYIYTQMAAFFNLCIGELALDFDFASKNEQLRLMGLVLVQLLKLVGPMFAVALLVGVIVNYAQVGWLFILEPLKPKFSKINPLNGIKRIFSLRGIVELIKSILKISIVGIVAWNSIKAEAHNIIMLMDLDLLSVAEYITTTTLNIAIKICFAMLSIGVLDFGYQWWQYEKDLKMTKQEIKEEYKETEGNPEIKQRIRSKQREISGRRMLSEVPKADVIITNPTHFAVAISYDSSKAPAPVVIAKGQDYLAKRIKEVAKENNVEVVENKPLAQTLYRTVDIGQEVPPELYQAVAEILAFVYRIKNKSTAQAQ
ncbi:MAG: flagellar biosynthesis protein FlhB [Clostridiaceae bacterium]|jgi:flagellar biosynthetic protein FlhB|nr:flagellar biosynthesis protein FlhB [Clostridiaceae bacterium]